jgi:hypothetical protein
MAEGCRWSDCAMAETDALLRTKSANLASSSAVQGSYARGCRRRICSSLDPPVIPSTSAAAARSDSAGIRPFPAIATDPTAPAATTASTSRVSLESSLSTAPVDHLAGEFASAAAAAGLQAPRAAALVYPRLVCCRALSESPVLPHIMTKQSEPSMGHPMNPRIRFVQPVDEGSLLFTDCNCTGAAVLIQ